MTRRFNIAGPCKADLHYMLAAELRSPALLALVESQQYFVLHAPRQVGKTTALLGLAERLTREGKYAAILLSVEAGAPFPEDIDTAQREILRSWQGSFHVWLPPELRPPPLPETTSIGAFLSAWAAACPRPLVVFLDEIDGLAGSTLLAILRQLRAGFPSRPTGFPYSLCLCGMRDVRDYKIASGGSSYLNTSSPFNVKSESLTLRNFTAPETADLLLQHTAQTGQTFEEAALTRVFALTRGQPWLVNALARECVERLVPDREEPVTAGDVEKAKENLILRRDTHLDSLAERLREDRVRRVIEPILSSGLVPSDLPPDDLRYVEDLGLVTTTNGLEIANPIYKEVIPRALSWTLQVTIPLPRPSWLRAEGSLDERALLDAFVAFWRQHGEALETPSGIYPEIAPHLVLMAFLHRVINGGGSIDREYAIGRERMDLCVKFRGCTIGIEIKRDDGKRKNIVEAGLAQIDEYLSGLGLSRGWLFVFDQRKDRRPVPDRLVVEERVSPGGRAVTVILG